jgi:hypothetical protein
MQADAIQIAKRAAAEMYIRPEPTSAEREEAPLDKDYQPPNGPEDYGLSSEVGIPTTAPATPISPGGPRFVPIAIDDVVVSAEPAWLIEGLLPARGLACIVGPPKSGKSFLTSDMTCAVARGVPYAGRATMQGPVVYLTGEGVGGFKRRLVAMRRHHGIEGEGIPFYMIENVPDLGSEQTDLPQLITELDAFIAQRAADGVRGIVLDTLARCCPALCQPNAAGGCVITAGYPYAGAQCGHPIRELHAVFGRGPTGERKFLYAHNPQAARVFEAARLKLKVPTR